MEKQTIIKKIGHLIYEKLFKINDSAHKIALGAALGIFSGIFPGTGPIAALFLALIFRANRAAAIIGSLISNTWMSFVIFIAAVQLGSLAMGVKWQDVQNSCGTLIKDFNWKHLFEFSILKIILPVLLGYFLIAFLISLIAYLVIFGILRKGK